MEELRDLQEINNEASEKFSQYNGKDFVLPSYLKERVKEINSNTITISILRLSKHVEIKTEC